MWGCGQVPLGGRAAPSGVMDNQSRALDGVQGGRAVRFFGDREPRLPSLRGCLAGTAAPVPGCVPRRATGTHLQMAVLKAWVGEDGGFPPVLGFCFFFIIKI